MDRAGLSGWNDIAADYLCWACQRTDGYHRFITAEAEHLRANPREVTWQEGLDLVMLFVSFVPVVGLVGDAYFLGKGLYVGVTTGEWGWLTMGLSAVGVAGMAVGMVRAARMLGRANDLADAAKVPTVLKILWGLQGLLETV